MNALADTFRDIFMGPVPVLTEWQRDTVLPFLQRLAAYGTHWQSEDAVCDGNVGMSIIGARCFHAKDLGLIEYRQRAFRRGWWIRMTPKGWRYLEAQHGQE